MEEDFQDDVSTLAKRDCMGRFSEGNTEGRKFPKGYDGRPKGIKNKKTLIAREFAYDVLHTDPETGKKMTYKQLVYYIAKKADASPRILNLLLDHYLGKPIERVEHEIQTIHITTDRGESSPENKNIITIIGEDTTTEDAEVVEEEQKSLPEGE
jgi:hypothetical protein